MRRKKRIDFRSVGKRFLIGVLKDSENGVNRFVDLKNGFLMDTKFKAVFYPHLDKSVEIQLVQTASQCKLFN